MIHVFAEAGKYIMILLMGIYVYQCFCALWSHEESKKASALNMQRIILFVVHFIAYVTLLLKSENYVYGILYLMQAFLFLVVPWAYAKFYPMVSKQLLNNMCMLLMIGFVIVGRLSVEKVMKQSIIATAGLILCFIVPLLIRKVKFWDKLRYIYAFLGILSLGAVLVIGQVSGGAKLGFQVGGFGIQPSEFVKILFVFFVASGFSHSLKFKNVVLTTIVAAFHVLILAISKDLGAALIIFVVYLVMLYVATKQPFYAVAGIGAGCLAAVAAYFLFSHVKVRVDVWVNPFADYENHGYQVVQSLFAIGTGGWFGTGLFRGKVQTIPVAAEDFVFSAISEELGLWFAIFMICVSVCCYLMIVDIAKQLKNNFYKWVALGLGTCYIFQTFLTVGGAINFIPSTGVTLPFVSYGGSSVLSSIVMFAIIQGLYIVKEEEEELEKQEKESRTLAKRAVKKRTKTTK